MTSSKKNGAKARARATVIRIDYMGHPTRRRFLELSALTSVAAALGPTAIAAAASAAGQAAAPSAPCTDAPLTPAMPGTPGFRPNSPARTSLREAGAAAPGYTLSGSVIGVRCGRIKDARVDFWQADPGGRYDAAGTRFRGHQLTDAEGRYRLESAIPGAAAGSARRLHVRITPPGKPGLTTTLYFPDDANRTKDKSFRPELIMKPATGLLLPSVPSGSSSVSSFFFDFILDL
jgi:protocatechuate 3,4-dioxygenase beta subunit